MGATTFDTYGLGKTPDEAFRSAQENARYYHGHGGYSGTIAEKDGYRLVTLPPRVTPDKLVEWIYLAEDDIVEYAKEFLQDEERRLKEAKRGTIRVHQARVRKARESLKAAEKQRLKYIKAVGAHKRFVDECAAIYDDKWGAALAFEITGTKAKEYKERHGRKGTRDRVFFFTGYASC